MADSAGHKEADASNRSSIDPALVNVILSQDPLNAPTTSSERQFPRAHLSQDLGNQQAKRLSSDAARLALASNVPDLAAPVPRKLHNKSLSLSSPAIQHDGFQSRRRQNTSPSRAGPQLDTLMERSASLVNTENASSDDATIPDESTDFLTLLARQERRVMELRDQLAKAESELTSLKGQWAAQEVAKRTRETTRSQVAMHRMRPMSVSFLQTPPLTRAGFSDEDPDGSSAWMMEEMAKRKSRIGTGHARSGSRRVFNGSRHARALSLVPQTQKIDTSSTASQVQVQAEESISNTTADITTAPRPLRAATLSQLSEPGQIQSKNMQSTQLVVAPGNHNTDAILEQGKQIASDFREGLWTFWEDLRQAAVGQDVRQPSPAQTKGGQQPAPASMPQPPQQGKSEQSSFQRPLRTSSKAAANKIDDSFWNEFGVGDTTAESGRAELKTPQKPVTLHTRVIDGEAWETWDTPDRDSLPSSSARSNSSSSVQSNRETLLSAPNSSPIQPADDTFDDDSISVSKLKLSPTAKGEHKRWSSFSKHAGHLRKTASHLMEEWERTVRLPESRSPDPLMQSTPPQQHQQPHLEGGNSTTE